MSEKVIPRIGFPGNPIFENKNSNLLPNTPIGLSNQVRTQTNFANN